MKLIGYLFSILIFINLSCKKDVKTPVVSDNKNSIPSQSQLNAPKGSIVKLLRADQAFMDLCSSMKPAPMVTDSIWAFYFALSLSEATPKENIYQGHWLDLLDGGKYKKGIYESTTDEGYYWYKPEDKTIEFRSTQRDSSSEWGLRVDPDAMLLIGTAKYNNNPWQIKLLRKFSYPQRGVALKNEKLH